MDNAPTNITPVLKDDDYSGFQLSPVQAAAKAPSLKEDDYSGFAPSPVQRSPENDEVSPVQRSPENDEVSPVQRSPENDEVSPVQRSPENDEVSPVTASKDADYSSFKQADPYAVVKATENIIKDHAAGKIKLSTEELQKAEQDFIENRAKDLEQHNLWQRTGRALHDTNWSDVGKGVVDVMRNNIITRRLGIAPAEAQDKYNKEFEQFKKEQDKKGFFESGKDQAKLLASAPVGAIVGAAGDTAMLGANVLASGTEEIKAGIGNDYQSVANAELNRLKGNAAYAQKVGELEESLTPQGFPKEQFGAGRLVGQALAAKATPGIELAGKSQQALADITKKVINYTGATAMQVVPKALEIGAKATLLKKGAGVLQGLMGEGEGAGALAGYSVGAMQKDPVSFWQKIKQGTNLVKDKLVEAPAAMGKAYKLSPAGESIMGSIVDNGENLMEDARLKLLQASKNLSQAEETAKLARTTVAETGLSTVDTDKALAAAKREFDAANQSKHITDKAVQVASWIQDHKPGHLKSGIVDGLSSVIHGAVIGAAITASEKSPGENDLSGGITQGATLAGIIHMLGSAGLSAEAKANEPTAQPKTALEAAPEPTAPSGKSPLREIAGKEAVNKVEIKGAKHDIKELSEAMEDAAHSTIVEATKAYEPNARGNSIVSEPMGAPEAGLASEPIKPATEAKPKPTDNIEAPKQEQPITPQESEAVIAERQKAKDWRDVIKKSGNDEQTKQKQLKAAGIKSSQRIEEIKSQEKVEEISQPNNPANVKVAPPAHSVSNERLIPTKPLTVEQLTNVRSSSTPVEGSTRISEYGYDPKNNILRLIFKRPGRGGSKEYVYYDSNPMEAATFMSPETASKGKFIDNYLKYDRPHWRVIADKPAAKAE